MAKELFIGVPKKKIALTNLVPSMDNLSFYRDGRPTSDLVESNEYAKYTDYILVMYNAIGGLDTISSHSCSLIPEHKYYMCYEAYLNGSSGTISVFGLGSITDPVASISNNQKIEPISTWNKYSGIVTVPEENDYNIVIWFNSDAEEEFIDYVYIDGIMLIDLTEIFGAGNEPDLAWCDEKISYATGDFSIELPSDGSARKAIDMFIGKDGVAKRIKEAFIGINGIAKKIFEAGPPIINFTIEGISYQAEEGMTWLDWINSKYNTDGYYQEGYVTNIVYAPQENYGFTVVYIDTELIKDGDVISLIDISHVQVEK